MGGKFTIWDFEEILLLNSVFAKLLVLRKKPDMDIYIIKMPAFIQVKSFIQYLILVYLIILNWDKFLLSTL